MFICDKCAEIAKNKATSIVITGEYGVELDETCYFDICENCVHDVVMLFSKWYKSEFLTKLEKKGK